MSIQLTCPAGHILKVADAWAGRVGRCPVCKSIINVPAAGLPTAGSPAASPDTTSDVVHAQNTDVAPAATANELPMAQSAVSHTEPHAHCETDTGRDATPTKPPMNITGVSVDSAPATAASTPRAPPVQPPPDYTATQQPPAEATPSPRVAADTRQATKPPRESPMDRSIGSRLARQAHASRRLTQYGLAIGAAALGLFCMMPALAHRNLAIAPAWARVALLVATLQIGYAIWAMTIPDRSAVRVLMVAVTAVAAGYATTLAVALTTPASESLPLDLTDVRKQAAAWCAAVMLLASLLAYACGRAGWSRE